MQQIEPNIHQRILPLAANMAVFLSTRSLTVNLLWRAESRFSCELGGRVGVVIDTHPAKAQTF